MGTPLDTSTGVNLAPLNDSASRRTQPGRQRWIRRYRRARIVVAMLILIGITTPYATSAPAGEAQLDLVSPLLTLPGLDHPPVIMLIGAAMLIVAGMLRRSERPRIH